MDSNNTFKKLPEDTDYILFMVYLRKNGVWKVVDNVFRTMNENRPDDPIEYFRANAKPENDENRAVEQMRRKIAEGEQQIKRLKRDKQSLTDLLSERIRYKSNYFKSRGTIDETSFFDSDHVE